MTGLLTCGPVTEASDPGAYPCGLNRSTDSMVPFGSVTIWNTHPLADREKSAAFDIDQNMVNRIMGLGVIPENLSTVKDEELEVYNKHLIQMKRDRQREIDHIDTEIIGIKEELRKRKELRLAEQIFQNAYIED